MPFFKTVVTCGVAVLLAMTPATAFVSGPPSLFVARAGLMNQGTSARPERLISGWPGSCPARLFADVRN
eukprot:1642751-Rhodomonas_salina.2